MNGGPQTHELDRALGELLKLGRVVSVDLAAGRCVVELGDEEEGLRTGPIPWAAARAGETRIWCPPTEGEQVLVALPEGDIERAIVVGSAFSDDIPAPADTGATVIAFADGAVLQYDPAAHVLTINLPAGAVAVTAPEGVSIIGPVSIEGAVMIEGDVDVTGAVTASEDVLGGGKSLKTHKHSGVQAGAAQTGLPV